MDIYARNGRVHILASPSKDGRADYTGDQARHLADELLAAAHDADAYVAGIAQQAEVLVPSTHIAHSQNLPGPVRQTVPAAPQEAPAVSSGEGVTKGPAPAKKRRVRTASQKQAANKRRAEKRAAEKK